jgi:hypothetical protein
VGDPKPKCEPARLQQYRAEWTALREAWPDKSTTELRTLALACYRFLRRNDLFWLSANCPPSKKHQPKGRVDWAARDKQLFSHVRKVKDDLLLSHLEPKRITRESLIRRLGEPSSIKKNLERLPLTVAELESAVESRLDFALRRIYWVADQMRKTGKVMKWALTLRSCARCPDLLHHPLIDQAIENEVAR